MRDDPDGGDVQVMEHREPPRIGPSERRIDEVTGDAGGRFRVGRSDVAGDRRHIDFARVGLVVLAGVAVVTVLAYLGTWAARASVGWLAQQPQYQVPFQQIELVNEPPRWFEGGTQKFLEGVRQSSREPDHVSMLDITPDALAAVFKKYAWVDEVARVAYVAGRIRVELQYRQPVGWVQLRDTRQLMVDDDGTILPTENIDVTALGVLPKIEGDGGLAPPVGTQFGEKWKSRTEPGGLEEVDERIAAAARLAGFLMQDAQVADAERTPALRMRQIILTDFDNRGLFMMNAEDAAILWGDAPGTEKPGKPSAQDKWAILRRWEESTPARFLETGDFWAFSRNGLVHVCPVQHAVRHRPKSAAERPVGAVDNHPNSPQSG
jgi:hypothetical protein